MVPRVSRLPHVVPTILSVAAACSTGAGCTAILGMDAPVLCPDETCSDASSTPLGVDAGPPYLDATDSPDGVAPLHDGGIGGPDGDLDALPVEGAVGLRNPGRFRCGGGTLGDAGSCAPPDDCCLTTGSAGPQYSCQSSTDCSNSSTGYPIECATSTDCASGYVCCHFPSATTCVPEYDADGGPGHCLNGKHFGDLVCDPNDPTSCLAGMTCKYALDDWGVLFGCWPKSA